MIEVRTFTEIRTPKETIHSGSDEGAKESYEEREKKRIIPLQEAQMRRFFLANPDIDFLSMKILHSLAFAGEKIISTYTIFFERKPKTAPAKKK